MNSNILNSVRIPKIGLLFYGHWPEKNPSIFTMVREITSFVITIAFVISMVVELFNHFDNYEILSEHLSITTSPTSFLFKLVIFKINSTKFLELMNHLEHSIFTSYDNLFDTYMKDAIKLSTILGIIYQSMCGIVIALYCCVPWVTNGELPIRFSYPIEKYWIAMYIFQAISMINAAAINSCLDLVACNLMNAAAAQIKICNDKIITCKRFLYKKKGKLFRRDEDTIRILKNCVLHHSEIITLIDEIEQVFSPIFLVQYLTSIVVICNIGFQLAHVKPGFQFAHMIFYFISMMGQMGMYCWFGNEVTHVSIASSDACYDSDWTECDTKTRRLLLIIMERSKRPLFLTAGKFSKLSLHSFTSVINASYSYFALMQRLYTKSQSA